MMKKLSIIVIMIMNLYIIVFVVGTNPLGYAGVITDGDLRRQLSGDKPMLQLTARDVMSTTPHTIEPSALAAQALQVMEVHQITALVVINDTRQVQGVVHLHDLWRIELF